MLWSDITATEGVVVQGGIGLTNIRNKFLAEEWEPTVEPLNTFVARLEVYKLKLSNDRNPINDSDLRHQLL